MKVVIDTNVLVSGLLSPHGTSAEIMRMLVSGAFELLYDARILSEYEAVLNRPKFGFDKTYVADLIEFIERSAIPVSADAVLRPIPDPDDAPFLEVAISGGADCIITGNITHYPIKSRGRIKVFTPRQFINRNF